MPGGGAWYGFWGLWSLQQKVTFDGINKLILINYGITDIDVKIDLYSNWKEWLLVDDNAKFLEAIRGVGGDPTVGDDALGSTFFLINGWKIRTWEGDHELSVVGNMFSDDGNNPFVNTISSHNILITRIVSNIIDLKGFEENVLTIDQQIKFEKMYKNSGLHTVLLLSK